MSRASPELLVGGLAQPVDSETVRYLYELQLLSKLDYAEYVKESRKNLPDFRSVLREGLGGRPLDITIAHDKEHPPFIELYVPDENRTVKHAFNKPGQTTTTRVISAEFTPEQDELALILSPDNVSAKLKYEAKLSLEQPGVRVESSEMAAYRRALEFSDLVQSTVLLKSDVKYEVKTTPNMDIERAVTHIAGKGTVMRVVKLDIDPDCRPYMAVELMESGHPPEGDHRIYLDREVEFGETVNKQVSGIHPRG